MKKAYVSPEAVKVNFEVNDIITISGKLNAVEWSDWTPGNGVMSISWDDLIGG